MDKEECAKIIFTIRANYQNEYRQMTSMDFDYLLDSWCVIFKDYSYADCSRALYTFINGDTKGFAPKAGQLIDLIHRIYFHQEDSMNAMDAWNLVCKAIRNSNYNADTEFEKLPEVVRRAVGSADTLREWASMDSATVHSVEQSHFIRLFNTEQKKMSEERKYPREVKEFIKQNDKAKQVADAEQVTLGKLS